MSKDTININVTYPAAPKPFHDKGSDGSETLLHLKERVLAFFGLTEGADGTGKTTTYVFYRGREALEDLATTIASLAGQAHALSLTLSQQIVLG